MSIQILEFITRYSSNVIIDVARRITLRFSLPVNEILTIQFLEPTDVVGYSFVYKGEKNRSNDVPSFLASFGPDNYLKVDSIVDITITIKKDCIQLINVNNFNFFMDYKSFFLSLTDVSIKNHQKKLIVLLLNEDVSFESHFIKVISMSDISTSIDDRIEEVEIKTLETLNTLFKDRFLKSYLDYPMSWISLEESETLYLFRKQTLETFLSIISNVVTDEGSYLIRGYKTVIITTAGDDTISDESCKLIEYLLRFIIDEQRSYDKLLILRNTMTLFLDSEEDVDGIEKKIKEIRKNVEFNFNAYVQDKVKIFLEQKNKLLQEFINTTKKIEELTSSMVSQLRTVLLSLLGTIFISLINDLNKGKTPAILNLVLLSYIFFLVMQLILILYQNKNKKVLLNILEKYTGEFGQIGNGIEDDYSYKKLKERYLDETINIYNIYRISSIVVLGILIILFTLLFFSNRLSTFPKPKEIIKIIIGY